MQQLLHTKVIDKPFRGAIFKFLNIISVWLQDETVKSLIFYFKSTRLNHSHYFILAIPIGELVRLQYKVPLSPQGLNGALKEHIVSMC